MPRGRDTGLLPRLLAGAALLWLAAAGGGCAGAPVAVDYDPDTEFLFYRTFAWLGHVGEPSGEPESLPGARVHKVVAEALAAHGITEADPATADLWVRYRTGVRTEVVHTPVYIDPLPVPYAIPDGHRDPREPPPIKRFNRDGAGQPHRSVPPARSDGAIVYPYRSYIYVDRTRFYVGTLTIELIDREQRRVVWEGTTSDTATSRDTARRPTPQAATRIMAAFPPLHP